MNPQSTSVEVLNPYPGLRAFEVHEFDSFFGRDRQVDELLGRLRDHRFVAVIGLSGSGKSSLVRAGLIHRLQVGHLTSAGSQWHVAIFRPGSEPIDALATALDRTLGEAPNRAAELRKNTQQLLHTTRSGRRPEENLLLVVDQFEEVFRLQRDELISKREANHFVDLLLAAEQDLSPDYRIYVVLTMRTDYLGDCAQFDDLPEALNRSQYLVPRLTREELREAIEGPAALMDTEITSELLQALLVESAEGRDMLPLLQHLLMRLWDKREAAPGGGWRITLAQYQDLGGMAQALNHHADATLKRLSEEQQQLAKRIFQQLTEVGQDRDQRRPMRLPELAKRTDGSLPEVTAVTQHFIEASFLTSPDRDRVQDWQVDISHESLIRQWKMLSNWAKEEAKDRDDYLYFAERVERGGEPLTGTGLTLALKWRDRNHSPEWAKRYGGDFPATVALIDRSCKRDRIRRIGQASVVVIVFSSLVVYLLVMYRNHQNQQRTRDVTNARQLGVKEGLEQGQAAARSIVQGLADASVGNFGGALRQLKLAGGTDATLPIKVLDQAIVDSEGRNDSFLKNLWTTRQHFLELQGLAAAGMNAAILRTENGGKNWQKLDIGTGSDLWSVAFTTSQSGWATGEGGTVLHTEDGGRSWHGQNSRTSVELLAITFVDAQSGWVTGGYGTILHTEDGGHIWQTQSSGTGASLGCLSFVNLRSGWSAGRDGIILHTENGGNSWYKQRSPARGEAYLRSLTFVTLQSGWVVGQEGIILHTDDGGNTWEKQSSGTDAWLYGITFVSQQSGWIVGQRGTILHTEDGGRHWTQQASSTNYDLHAVSFLTSRTGWVAGESGTILQTDNGGLTWGRLDTHSKDALYSITFVRQW